VDARVEVRREDALCPKLFEDERKSAKNGEKHGANLVNVAVHVEQRGRRHQLPAAAAERAVR
jgi:hypothetical protein